jgi:hypothetical protein
VKFIQSGLSGVSERGDEVITTVEWKSKSRGNAPLGYTRVIRVPQFTQLEKELSIILPEHEIVYSMGVIW